jgi:hypothetical protein
MNEGQFIALRSYGRGNQALLQQILDELKALNSKLGAPTKEAAPAVKVPAEAVGPVTVETVEVKQSKPTTAKGKPKVKPAVNWNS